MEASLDQNPSQTWQSIWGARKLLEKGVRWRVGNRQDIPMWKNKWLPSSWPFTVQSPQSLLDENNRVSELIDPYMKCWNKELVQSMFAPTKAKIISALPISRLGSSDDIVWLCDNKGVYSVKSGYKLLCNADQAGTDLTNVEDVSMRKVWKKIWTEAEAAAHAMGLTKDIGFSRITMVRNSLGTIKKLKEGEPDLSPVGTVNEEARSKLMLFCAVDVMHVTRKKNRVAHPSSKYALQISEAKTSS